jgi:hypothetical protein
MLPAIAPATIATKPSRVFHAIVKYSSRFPRCAVADLKFWQTEITKHFQQENRIHFAAEELILFPAAREFKELISLVEELSREHTILREDFAQAEARSLSVDALLAFAQRLS